MAFAVEIASVLRQDLGATRAAVKTLVAWTGANERTVKNWLAGRYSPSGVHLIALMRRSDRVFARVLDMAGRRADCDLAEIAKAEHNLLDALAFVRGLAKAGDVPGSRTVTGTVVTKPEVDERDPNALSRP